MKTLRSYIARNLASFVALIVGLVVMNVLVFGLFFFNAISGEARGASPTSLLDSVEGASDSSGVSAEADKELRSRGVWAMFVGADGDASPRGLLPSTLSLFALLAMACWSWAIPKTAL